MTVDPTVLCTIIRSAVNSMRWLLTSNYWKSVEVVAIQRNSWDWWRLEFPMLQIWWQNATEESHYLLPPHFLWPLGKVMAAPPALAKPHRNNTGCWGTGKLFIFDLLASLQLVKPRQRLQTTGRLIRRVLKEGGGLRSSWTRMRR